MKHTIFFLLSFIILGFFACETMEDPKVENSSVYPLSGTWSVREYYEDGSIYPDLSSHPYHLLIYNSANGGDTIWIENIYDYNVKAKALKTGISTFSVDNSFNINEPPIGGPFEIITVKITNGKIINNDSIYFEVILDGPVVHDSLSIAGHRYAGFPDED